MIRHHRAPEPPPISSTFHYGWDIIILLHKPSQHTTRKVYSFVPMQDFDQPWSDEKLYRKYSLTKDEIGFIEKLVRPMSDRED